MRIESHSPLNPAARVELRTATTELLWIDMRISQLETVLKQLLGRPGNPTARRVEPLRRPC